MPHKDLVNGHAHANKDPTCGSISQVESVVLQEKFVEQVQHPVSYNQTDSLQLSFVSESLKKICDPNCIEKIQATKENPKENIPSFYQAANFSKNISSATGNGDINNTLKVNYDQISVQVSDHIIPTSTNVKPAINSQIVENQQHVTNGMKNL